MKNYFFLYAEALKKYADIKKPVKIVLDASNGISAEIFKKINLPNLTIKTINDQPDGDFPAHGPNPMSEGAFADLPKIVVKEKADFGVILDGDGDRTLFCDEKGQEISTDILIRLVLPFLKPKKIILDPRNGYLIKNYCRENGIDTVPSRAGRYFIQKQMMLEKADLAAETSGHFFFLFKIGGEDYRYDSAARMIMEAVSAVSKLPYSLSAFSELLPQYFRIKETNLSVRNRESAIKKLDDFFRVKAERISRLDGLSMEFSTKAGRWWFNIRPSMNEPVIRLNMESESEALLQDNLKKIKRVIADLK